MSFLWVNLLLRPVETPEELSYICSIGIIASVRLRIGKHMCSRSMPVVGWRDAVSKRPPSLHLPALVGRPHSFWHVNSCGIDVHFLFDHEGQPCQATTLVTRRSYRVNGNSQMFDVYSASTSSLQLMALGKKRLQLPAKWAQDESCTRRVRKHQAEAV